MLGSCEGNLLGLALLLTGQKGRGWGSCSGLCLYSFPKPNPKTPGHTVSYMTGTQHPWPPVQVGPWSCSERGDKNATGSTWPWTGTAKRERDPMPCSLRRRGQCELAGPQTHPMTILPTLSTLVVQSHPKRPRGHRGGNCSCSVALSLAHWPIHHGLQPGSGPCCHKAPELGGDPPVHSHMCRRMK